MNKAIERAGILLAGGLGTRLRPMTLATPKHLLPVYNRPMVYYPLSTMISAGIKDILVITTREGMSPTMNLLGMGSQWGVKLFYAIQEDPAGIADALRLAESWLDGRHSMLILGDNLFHGIGFSEILRECSWNPRATIFCIQVQYPQRYGVVRFHDGFPSDIVEKPVFPKDGDMAIPGIYFYPPDAPAIARGLRPSGRGELEISHVNQVYLDRQLLDVRLMSPGFSWFDMGTVDTLLEAACYVKAMESRYGNDWGPIDPLASPPESPPVS